MSEGNNRVAVRYVEAKRLLTAYYRGGLTCTS